MKNKGQISGIILWAAGIISTVILGYTGYTMTAISSLSKARTTDIQRITVTETKVSSIEEDIKEIKYDVKSILRALKK